MDYREHYNKLINRARNRLLEGYTEKHHIVPRCIDGSNDVENIVTLTPEEHYVAHQLLVKIYPENKKLVFAAHMMTVGSLNHSGRNNKSYGWLRMKYSEAQKGNTNGKGNKGRKQSKEERLQRSEARKGKTWEEIYGIEGAKIRKEKQSNSLKGKPSGMLGKIAWNKGIPRLEVSKQKQSETMTGKKRGPYKKRSKQCLDY